MLQCGANITVVTRKPRNNRKTLSQWLFLVAKSRTRFTHLSKLPHDSSLIATVCRNIRHSAHPERIELFFTGSIIVSFQPRKDTHGISPRYGFNGYSKALQQ